MRSLAPGNRSVLSRWNGGFWLAALMCVVALAARVSACEIAADKIDAVKINENALGTVVGNFELRDFYGKTHHLADYADRRLVVVVFIGNECPLVKLYAPRLTELAAEFGPRGVAFLGINANRQDTLTEIAAFARQMKIEFPILKDPDNAVADQFAARRTPEAFVLDRGHKICYRGRIDDQFGIGFQRGKAEHRDLAMALEELLADKPVSAPLAEATGCLIGRTSKVTPHGEVTYANQIVRIINRRCLECHRAGEVGPFPLDRYEEVVGWADMIREVVDQGRMPPWFADPHYGKFENDARLTEEERATIDTWVANGAPQGDLSQLPEPPQFVEGWRIPKPDLVLNMSDTPFEVAATGVVDYQYFSVDPGFKTDMWVKAAEARPGNRAVVHHHVAYFVPPGAELRGIEQVKNQIAGYAPGTPPFLFPDGVAMRIPAGSKIVFQMHYTPCGTVQQDRSCLGLIFADPASVKQAVRGEMLGNIGIHIPPGDADYRLNATRKFRHDMVVLNLAPHMHMRGKSYRFELEQPDGRRETLLDVPRYNFNWQLRYDLVEPLIFPKGSKLHCYAVFDNSDANPLNPDPTREVTFGEQSWEEMMFGIFQVIEPVDAAKVTGTPAGDAPGQGQSNDAG